MSSVAAQHAADVSLRHGLDARNAVYSGSAIAVLALLCMAPAFLGLGRYWALMSEYHHGFLIVAISLTWMCLRIRECSVAGVRPAPWLLPALGVAMLLWYSFWQGHSEMGMQVVAPIVVWLVLATYFGWRRSGLLFAPIAYFYFSVPIWDYLLPVLRQVTVFGAKYSMILAGIPVTVNDTRLAIPEGTFEVVDACSGLRFMLVSMALVCLYGAVEKMDRGRLLILMTAAVVLAVIANWLRVFIVMYAGHVTEMSHYFITGSHEGIGNVVFVGLLLVLFGIARRLNRETPIASKPVLAWQPGATQTRQQWMAASVAGLLTVFGLLMIRVTWATPMMVAPQLLPLPVGGAQWRGPLPSNSRWFPEFEHAHEYRRASYRLAPDSSSPRARPPLADVYINIYGVQRSGQELIFYRNSIAPRAWQHLRSHVRIKSTVGALKVDEYRTADDDERWLLAQTFVVGGRSIVSSAGTQLLYGFSTLTTASPAGVIAIAIRCDTDCQHEIVDLQRFWQELGEGLIAALPTRLETRTDRAEFD